MNKRFSTLLAAALVAGGLSANAQTAIGSYSATAVSAGDKIYTSNPVRNYVLGVDGLNEVITVENGVAKVVAVGTSSNVMNDLWTVSVTSVSGSNRFVLTNKVTGETLSYDPKNAVKADANGAVTAPTAGTALDAVSADTEWTWYAAADLASGLDTKAAFSCAFKTDSTMSLAKTANGEIYAVKYANAKDVTGVTPLQLQIGVPGTQKMTADDLNVLEGSARKYFTLSTNKTGLTDPNNVLTQKYHAFNYNGMLCLAVVNANGEYVNTSGTVVSGSDILYAAVDTAYHVGTGTNTDKLYQLALKKTGSQLVTMDFTFTRDLFKDSLTVSVNKKALATKRTTPDATGSSWDFSQNADLGETPTISAVKLTADTEVLTVWYADTDEDDPSAATENLLFALASPAADNTLTSIADGVYYIKNEKGQYYASPIHKEGDAAWVTVNAEEQNVADMPAFQWVILKDKTSDKASATSPVTVVNREFATLIVDGQLKKNEGATYYYGLAGLDSVAFEAVPAAALSDSLLGYKNLEANDLKVNRYTFNYLHAYAQDKYIAKSATDSLATVLNGKGIFTITAVGDIEDYGYDVTDAVKARIPGLVKLYRQAYSVALPGGANLGENAEDKYAICEHMDAATFWFKENNHIGDVHYHAMIQVAEGEAVSKAGVTDDDMSATLKDQVLSETRTSAFNISNYDAPLYRRFNSALLEGNEGDASDTLRFVEKYRGEYLQVEQNENFKVKGIDFLGIYTQDFTKDGKSFIVDTAWVGDGLKPLYLISIDREDQAFAEGEMCPVCKEIVDNGGTRPANCPHDAAGKVAFHFGQYLVNFADSVIVSDANKATYGWKGYTRAGFVKAAHQGDSLYILKDQFADVTLSTFNADSINAAITAGKYAAVNRINLAGLGRENKNVTWSMRYLNPEVAANEVEEDRAFLFESTKELAPVDGSWLKMQNGCLVLSGSDDSDSTFDLITNDDDALIFNVEKGNAEDIATENEVIVAEGITVVAGNGNVTIAGAAGKKVVIANILGQTVANTVLTSDNATIAVPAGIVVVAVEGEDAVKTIVK